MICCNGNYFGFPMYISSINTFVNVRTSLDIYGHILGVCKCVRICLALF